MLLCAEGTLAAQELGGPAVGFSAVPPLRAGGLVELTRRRRLVRGDRGGGGAVLRGTLGLHVAWVGDAPGLVLARIVASLVNEACFAIAEGVARAEDVDEGMELGLNHPRGPLAWADAMGIEHVVRGHRRPGRGHRRPTGTGSHRCCGAMLHEDRTFHG